MSNFTSKAFSFQDLRTRYVPPPPPPSPHPLPPTAWSEKYPGAGRVKESSCVSRFYLTFCTLAIRKVYQEFNWIYLFLNFFYSNDTAITMSYWELSENQEDQRYIKARFLIVNYSIDIPMHLYSSGQVLNAWLLFFLLRISNVSGL